MAAIFAEQQMRELLAPNLKAGERLLAFAQGTHQPPLWVEVGLGMLAFVGLLFVPMLTRHYAVGVTSRGLILVQLTPALQVKSSRVIPWDQIRGISYRKAETADTLVFKTAAGEQFRLSFQNNDGFRTNRKHGATVAGHLQSRCRSAAA